MKTPFLISAVASAMLTACGGGGTESNSPITSSPSPAPDPSAIVTAVAAPTYQTGLDQALAYAALNSARSTCGFGLLAQSAALDKAAAAHANYLTLNDVITHTEDATKSGFTAVTLGGRAIGAGYPYVEAGEVIGTGLVIPGDGQQAVLRLLASPYHERIALDQYRDIGLGVGPVAGWTTLTADLGVAAGAHSQIPASVVTYPCDGITGAVASNFGENPSPLSTAWGQPIVVRGASDLQVNAVAITGPQGPVAIQKIYGLGQASDPNNEIPAGWAAILPAPLQANTTYAVTINWISSGTPGKSSFSFSTGSLVLASP